MDILGLDAFREWYDAQTPELKAKVRALATVLMQHGVDDDLACNTAYQIAAAGNINKMFQIPPTTGQVH